MTQRTRIKICGITQVSHALHIARRGADSIGLVFHRPSSRYLELDAADEIRRQLPPFITVTALFLDEDRDWVDEVVSRLGPDCLQFHGNESPDFCSAWGRPYIKSIPMGSVEDPVAYAAQHGAAQGFLFDSNAAGRLGGSGDTFDWSRIPPAFDKPLILAGGINPDNVADAIARVAPWGVDVSTGVEQERGVKSIALIDRFIDEVARADVAGAALIGEPAERSSL